MNEIFSGVFKEGKSLFTVNMVPGAKVYGEKLVKKKKNIVNGTRQEASLALR